MWQNEPGVFEMMMKFFYLYNEDLKHNVKSFELSCRDFLEDIFMHYEKCAIKRMCSCCEKDDDTNEEPLDVGGECLADVKKEKDEVEIRETADFSGFVLSPDWREPPEPSPALEPAKPETSTADELPPKPPAEPPVDIALSGSWSRSSAPPIHLPSRIVQELGAGLKRNPTKRCRLCYRERRARRETRYWCRECPTKPGLCLEPCFRLWHQAKLACAPHLVPVRSPAAAAALPPGTWSPGVAVKAPDELGPAVMAPNG